MIIGEIIADLRKDKNYTQKELARLLNISAGCLSKYENGTTQPPLEMLIQISDALNVSTDYLLFTQFVLKYYCKFLLLFY